jgi:hypothetical protein
MKGVPMTARPTARSTARPQIVFGPGPGEPRSTEAKRIEQLEARVAELERALAERDAKA